MAINVIAAGALRVGQSIAQGARLFSRGVQSTVRVGTDTTRRAGTKIKEHNKKIKIENEKQEAVDKRVKEELQRREKENKGEKGKLVRPATNLVDSLIKKPLISLSKLILAWTIQNLPGIIKEVVKFTKKVRILVAATKTALVSSAGILKSSAAMVGAVIQNILSFDFTDKSGRFSSARQELADATLNLQSSFSEFVNVWGREDDELDAILKQLDEGGSFASAIDKAVNTRLLRQRAEVEGTTPVTEKAGGGPGNTASGGKWKPILELIAKAESVNGSYDSIYPSSIKPGLSEMTIAEADAWQARTASSRGSAAAGRYQFMDILNQAQAAGLTGSDKFSPSNQDKMAIALIEKKRGVTMEMLKENPVEAAKRLSMEWAGLPVLSSTTGRSRVVQAGQSYYAGDGLNKATVSTEELTGAMGQVIKPPPTPATPKSGGGPLVNSAVIDEANVTKDSHPTIGVTSGFGMRNGRMHKGIDIGTTGARGVLVGFRAKGKVTVVGNDSSGWGLYVVIYVPSMGMSFLFGHLRQIYVKQGQEYNGQTIGEIGNTGRSTGEHLHFEAIVGSSANGKRVAPNQYLGYLAIGRKTRSLASASTIQQSNKLTAASEETSSMVASKRTTGVKPQVPIIMKTTEVILT